MVIFGILSLKIAATSAEVRVEWDPSPETDIAGYRLYYDTLSGGRSKVIEVGNTTTATVPDLAPGSTYFCVATAYNTAGLESLPSNEISFTVANLSPTVSLASQGNALTNSAPADILLNASAADLDGSIARVEFYSGETRLGETLTAPYSFVWRGVPAGEYAVTAVASDNLGASATSQPISVIVTFPVVIQPGVTAVTQNVDGSIQLVVAGEAGQQNNVYVSEDMQTWTFLQSAINQNGTLTITDPLAVSREKRFYRVSDPAVTTEAAGFIKLRAAGRPLGAASAFSFIGLSLTHPIIYRGTVTSVGTMSLVDRLALWNGSQFKGASGDYFVEITSGPKAGLMADIVAVNSTDHSITIEEDFSRLLVGGEAYVIRKHRTIGDVFGKSNEAGLNASTSIEDADEIQVWNPITQSFLRFYFQAGGATANGWRTSTDPFTDASATKLYLDQGIVISRKSPGDISFVLTGVVRTGPTLVPVGTGSNLLANVYPAGILTLGNAGLYVGNGTLGLTGGTNIDSADEVRIYTGATYQRFYYKTGGSGGSGWRNSNDRKRDASQTQIAVGSAFSVIRKSGRSAFNWSAPQPF